MLPNKESIGSNVIKSTDRHAVRVWKKSRTTLGAVNMYVHAIVSVPVDEQMMLTQIKMACSKI